MKTDKRNHKPVTQFEFRNNNSPGKKLLSGRDSKTRPVSDNTGEYNPSTKISAPVSLEVEYRHGLVIVSQISRDIRHFRSQFKQENVDFENMATTAHDIVNTVDWDEADIETCRDFKKVLRDFKTYPNYKKKPEYDHLECYCDKGLHFQELIVSSKYRLKDLYENHCKKYFVSFSKEADDVIIKSAREYDEKLRVYHEDTENDVTELNQKLEKFWEVKVPFLSGYISKYASVQELMDNACALVVGICDRIRKWTGDDRCYAAKLWDEVISGSHSRSKTAEHLKKHERKKHEVLIHKQKREVARDKILLRLDAAQKTRRKIQNNRDHAQERVDRTGAELNSTHAAWCENDEDIRNRKSNSPRVLDMLWQRAEQLDEEITNLEEKLVVLKRHLDRQVRDEEEQSLIVESLAETLETHQGGVQVVDARLQEIESEVADTQTELDAKDARIAAAKKIRDSKLHPASLRKIFYNRSDVVKDIMGDVCRLVSKHIGDSWRDLYHSLPFLPPRDENKRIKDIEATYTYCLHRDQTLSEQAWHVLLKWRIFHRTGNPRQMVVALRKIRKYELARKVEVKSEGRKEPPPTADILVVRD